MNNTETITSLLNSLIEQTQAFRVQYLEQVEKWAVEQTVRNIQRKADFDKMTMDSGQDVSKGAILVDSDTYYREERFFYTAPAWFTKEAEMVKRHRKQAEAHFEAGLAKMVARIEKKGLDIESCKVTKIRLDINIAATVTDGQKEVRLFTIIASGPVQRPHYRYLCK